MTKTEKPIIITIRVKNPNLKWKLKEAAVKEKTTVSAMVEQFLHDGLEKLSS